MLVDAARARRPLAVELPRSSTLRHVGVGPTSRIFCPAWKYSLEKAIRFQRSQLIVIVWATRSTLPSLEARQALGVVDDPVLDALVGGSPKIALATSLEQSMSKPSIRR